MGTAMLAVRLSAALCVLCAVVPSCQVAAETCPGGFLYNFADPVPGKTVASLLNTLPGLMTAEACAETCASDDTGQTCQGFSIQEVSTAGLGVCRLGSSAESAAVAAPKTCGELGWEVFAASENQAVCATHQYTDTAIPCDIAVGKKSFAEAVVACDTVGARLCTGDELQSNVGAGEGCDFKDGLQLWTSDECEGGTKFEIAQGSKTEPRVAPLCRKATASRHVRCCADVSATEAAAAEHASAFQQYRSARGQNTGGHAAAGPRQLCWHRLAGAGGGAAIFSERGVMHSCACYSVQSAPPHSSSHGTHTHTHTHTPILSRSTPAYTRASMSTETPLVYPRRVRPSRLQAGADVPHAGNRVHALQQLRRTTVKHEGPLCPGRRGGHDYSGCRSARHRGMRHEVFGS